FDQLVVHDDSVSPDNSARRATTAGVGGVMTIWAVGPGAFGNNIAYQISNAGLDPAGSSKLFRLSLFYWRGGVPSPMFVAGTTNFTTPPTQAEVYDNLSPNPNDSTFYEGEINDISNLIVIKQTAAGRPSINTGTPNLNNAGDPIALAGGADGAPAVAGGKLFSKEDFTGGDQ